MHVRVSVAVAMDTAASVALPAAAVAALMLDKNKLTFVAVATAATNGIASMAAVAAAVAVVDVVVVAVVEVEPMFGNMMSFSVAATVVVAMNAAIVTTGSGCSYSSCSVARTPGGGQYHTYWVSRNYEKAAGS